MIPNKYAEQSSTSDDLQNFTSSVDPQKYVECEEKDWMNLSGEAKLQVKN